MNNFSYSHEDIKKLLPKREQKSHKGTYGRVLIIGGAPCMAGAPSFSARAAYRVGCGLVEIFTHKKNRVILQTLVPEAVLSVPEVPVSDAPQRLPGPTGSESLS